VENRRGGACCPVRAVRAWLDTAGITEGPVFRPVRKGDKIRDQRPAARLSTCADSGRAFWTPRPHAGLR